jgi:hypothetical protein
MYCRAAMYGSLLSGGFAGHIYGANALWGGDIEDEAPLKTWESLQWASGAQMQHLRTFALSEGTRYQDLVPNAELVTPNKSGPANGNRGWAFCARTPDRTFALIYFEADCSQASVRGLLPNRSYSAQWFDPRRGEWIDAGELVTNQHTYLSMPAFPSEEDWGLKLLLSDS